MKKIIPLILSLVLIFGLCSCGDVENIVSDSSFVSKLQESISEEIASETDSKQQNSQKDKSTASKKETTTSSDKNNDNKKEPVVQKPIKITKTALPEVKYSLQNSKTSFRDIEYLSNGGFVIAGAKETENNEISIIQTYDKNSNLLKEYSYNDINGFYKIAPCSDGGFIITSEYPTGVTKINSSFEIEWFKKIGNDDSGDGKHWINDIAEISPNCFAVFYNIWYETGSLYKISFLDKNGNLEKTMDLMSSKSSDEVDIMPEGKSVIPDGRGGFYLITAFNKSLAEEYPMVAKKYNGAKENEVAVMHFSKDLKPVEVNTLGGNGNDWVEESIIDDDGNFYIVLGTNSPQKDSFWEIPVQSNRTRRMLVKLDKKGNTVYKAPLSNTGYVTDWNFGIHIKNDKVYVVGMAYYFDGYQDKYPCEQISTTENNEPISSVYLAAFDKKGKELGRSIFRYNVLLGEPCGSVLLTNGSLVIAGRLDGYENSFDIKFPSDVNKMETLFVYEVL